MTFAVPNAPAAVATHQTASEVTFLASIVVWIVHIFVQVCPRREQRQSGWRPPRALCALCWPFAGGTRITPRSFVQALFGPLQRWHDVCLAVSHGKSLLCAFAFRSRSVVAWAIHACVIILYCRLCRCEVVSDQAVAPSCRDTCVRADDVLRCVSLWH